MYRAAAINTFEIKVDEPPLRNVGWAVVYDFLAVDGGQDVCPEVGISEDWHLAAVVLGVAVIQVRRLLLLHDMVLMVHKHLIDLG